ncbi:MAG: hypothetical protein H0T53_14260 [Herpetosiphonaceae bacterium]|nr:hypothetical protein [Herpetosiphonaceae bacterium]
MKFRLAMLGLIATLLLPLSVLARPGVPPAPEQRVPNVTNAYIDPASSAVTATPGSTFQLSFTAGNNSTAGEILDFDFSFTNLPVGWTAVASPDPITSVAPGEAPTFIVTVTVAGTAAPGLYAFGIRAIITSTGTPASLIRNASVQVTIVPPTATPTVTQTPTVTPTPTQPAGTVTATPNNVCNGQNGTRNDGYEPDDTKAQARRIELDILQTHVLCPVGDEDWLIFGGLEGKVYTIDMPSAVDGIDPSLTLYDDNGNQLAFNDDYYLRNNDPTDIKPRIQSWRAPANGQYYIKVRDAAGRGFFNAFYTLILESESYGPTPTLIPEICADIYEPDGLPEISRLMVIGEVHKTKRICPTGDADWVKFFAKAGKEYSIFTVNATPNIGLDTVLVLADRDGTTIIDFNDDFGTSLDSRIDFAPEVDGFYYAQVKNVGDVGTQFAAYSLTFQIKTNANGGGGDGGNPPTNVPPVVPPTTQPGATAQPGITPTVGSATVTPGGATVTPGGPTPTITVDPYSRPASKLPDFVINSAGKFADPAFARVWERADAPIAAGAATRSWLWGPVSGSARAEVYDQAPGGLRQVQYFDKSRMEITDFNASRASQWFVTNGLLAKEMIIGQIQLGDSSFVARPPAQINIAGDLDDKRGPTYASFTNQLGPAADRTSQYADATLSRDGKTAAYSGPQRDAAKLVTFVPQTQHNIASAFWTFLNRRGPISEGGKIRDGQVIDWVFALGYPISEPYWAKVRVGGVEQDVLVQAFERRVLTYTPSNPAEWQVEMGNVGQHYEQWRYE